MSDDIQLLCGNALEVLAKLPDESVHCCVTSPPYFGLRNYGVAPSVWGGDFRCRHNWSKESYYREGGASKRSSEAFTTAGESNAQRLHKLRCREDRFCSRCGAWRGCLGLERTPDFYVEHLAMIFQEVKRVLRHDGTLWLNLGDSYTGSWGTGSRKSGENQQRLQQNLGRSKRSPQYDPLFLPSIPMNPQLPAKNLLGIPWRVAFALQKDGWVLRSEITWCKRSAMPESVKDRPTAVTEKIFLFSKSRHYFYDQEAVKEPSTSFHGSGNGFRREYQHSKSGRGQEKPWDWTPKRNLRNYWLLSPEPFLGEHFAVFPTVIPRRAILAGTSERGGCIKCGTPWKRRVEKQDTSLDWQRASGGDRNGEYFGKAKKGSNEIRGEKAGEIKARILKGLTQTVTIGWEPGCSCSSLSTQPCCVLDPFCGSGTTALVSRELRRRFIGIDLKPEYIDLTKDRLQHHNS